MKTIKTITLIVILIALVYFLFNFFWINGQNIMSGNLMQSEHTANNIKAFVNRPVTSNSNELGINVASLIKTYKGDYAFYFRNLKTNQSFSYNKNKKFVSASLYKLWVAAAVLTQIEENKLRTDQLVSQKVAILLEKYNVDSSYALRKEESISFTVSEALEKMITFSDNDAALVLTDFVGTQYISDYLIKNGYLDSDLGEAKNQPQTTARDIGLFLERLYDDQVVNKASSGKIIDLMKNQQLNNKLSLGLPSDIVIAHKTGELDGISHDAGIVYTKKGDYVIVVLSSTDSQIEANERIAAISRMVYEYVANN